MATTVINHVMNNGGIGILSRLMAASKATLELAVSAYLQEDQKSDARSLRLQVLQAGLSAVAEHEALLKIEDELETAALNNLLRGA
jgi:hypothetical protein